MDQKELDQLTLKIDELEKQGKIKRESSNTTMVDE